MHLMKDSSSFQLVQAQIRASRPQLSHHEKKHGPVLGIERNHHSWQKGPCGVKILIFDPEC